VTPASPLSRYTTCSNKQAAVHLGPCSAPMPVMASWACSSVHCGHDHRLFELIAIATDGKLSDGANWHQLLLEQMSQEVPVKILSMNGIADFEAEKSCNPKGATKNEHIRLSFDRRLALEVSVRRTTS
jgi:hypothetical protein